MATSEAIPNHRPHRDLPEKCSVRRGRSIYLVFNDNDNDRALSFLCNDYVYGIYIYLLMHFCQLSFIPCQDSLHPKEQGHIVGCLCFNLRFSIWPTNLKPARTFLGSVWNAGHVVLKSRSRSPKERRQDVEIHFCLGAAQTARNCPKWDWTCDLERAGAPNARREEQDSPNPSMYT